jgi:hypothetical protein
MAIASGGVAGCCPVLMEDGHSVPLQNVKKGDRVVCDPVEGQSATVQCVVRFSGDAADEKTMLVQVGNLQITPLLPKIRWRSLSRHWMHPQDCIDFTRYRRPVYSAAVYNLVLDGEQHEMTAANVQCMTLCGSELRAEHADAWEAGLIHLPLIRRYSLNCRL